MKPSDIILTPIPQADGKKKNRPVLILQVMPKYSDFLVCGISSQLKQCVVNFDEIITPADNDFAMTGLITSSVIRLTFLAVIPQKKVIGLIGNISATRHQRLLEKLADYLLGKLIIT